MKITIFTSEGPVIYEGVDFIEVETSGEVQMEGINKNDVQIWRVTE